MKTKYLILVITLLISCAPDTEYVPSSNNNTPTNEVVTTDQYKIKCPEKLSVNKDKEFTIALILNDPDHINVVIPVNEYKNTVITCEIKE